MNIENQLFTWKGWDEHDTLDLQFYDVTLKVDIGEFKAGSNFETVAFLLSSSRLVLYDDLGGEHVFPLVLTVG